MTHGNHVYQKERVLLKQESEREGVRPWEEALKFASAWQTLEEAPEFVLSLAEFGSRSQINR